MILVSTIFFWFCVVLLFHSYFFYPFLLKILAKGKKINDLIFDKQNLPKVAIVIAAYNEEKVIEEKLISSLKTNYPNSLFQIFIGSDCSSDKTAEIVNRISATTAKITFLDYKERGGKQEVLNKLFKKEILEKDFDVCIMTDANIIFNEDTIYELVKHFENKKIGIVCANIKNKNIKEKGISKQEQFYILNENETKINEGKVFSSSIAAFGACYAIKRNLIPKIPTNILMEDFFISMHVLKQKFDIITEPKALCYEDLPQNINEEFKRKKRISTGNFQNLFIYFDMLFTARFGIAFSFFSHKVIRWLGPFLMLIAYISLWVLSGQKFYLYLLLLSHVIFALAILDYILFAVNINVNLLRLLRYFITMNIALFLGFIIFVKGVKTNIWQPTTRNE